MIICVCHRVSDRDIARAVQHGCGSFDELQFELSVAICCGKCHDCARETFEHHVARIEAAEALPDSRALPGNARVAPIAAHHSHDPMASAAA